MDFMTSFWQHDFMFFVSTAFSMICLVHALSIFLNFLASLISMLEMSPSVKTLSKEVQSTCTLIHKSSVDYMSMSISCID